MREAEAAMKAAAAKLAEVRDGPSTGLVTLPEKQKLVLSVKEGSLLSLLRFCRVSPVVHLALAVPLRFRRETRVRGATRLREGRRPGTMVVEGLGEGAVKVVASVPGRLYLLAK